MRELSIFATKGQSLCHMGDGASVPAAVRKCMINRRNGVQRRRGGSILAARWLSE